LSNQHNFRLFLSHAEENYTLVYRVWDILSRLKASPYMHELYPDYRQDIPTGIRDALRNCVMCITFLTKEGVNSQWVQQEVGMAYGFAKVIAPIIETGVEYKGFVQMVSGISYDPRDEDQMIYDLIYAVRNHVIGHNTTPNGISLTCPNRHEHDYTLPSTHDLNKAMDIAHVWVFQCLTCKSRIEVDPKTLERWEFGIKQVASIHL